MGQTLHADGHNRVDVGKGQQHGTRHAQGQTLLHGHRVVPLQHTTATHAKGTLVTLKRLPLVNRVAVLTDDQVTGVRHAEVSRSSWQIGWRTAYDGRISAPGQVRTRLVKVFTHTSGEHGLHSRR
ncbi:hypothetical protein D9M70_514090 [compost metagenome]